MEAITLEYDETSDQSMLKSAWDTLSPLNF